MPIRYSIDRVNKRLLTRADGVVTSRHQSAPGLVQRNRDLDLPELIEADVPKPGGVVEDLFA